MRNVDPSVVIRGQVWIGEEVEIGPYCVIGETGSEESITIDDHVKIGPGCVIRPGAKILERVIVGALSYVGDDVIVDRSLPPGSRVS